MYSDPIHQDCADEACMALADLGESAAGMWKQMGNSLHLLLWFDIHYTVSHSVAHNYCKVVCFIFCWIPPYCAAPYIAKMAKLLGSRFPFPPLLLCLLVFFCKATITCRNEDWRECACKCLAKLPGLAEPYIDKIASLLTDRSASCLSAFKCWSPHVCNLVCHRLFLSCFPPHLPVNHIMAWSHL